MLATEASLRLRKAVELQLGWGDAAP